MNGINESDSLISDIYSGYSAFNLPKDEDEKKTLIKLFEKLVSKPLSRRLVTELAYSNKRVNIIDGEGHFRYLYSRGILPSYRELAVPLKKNTNEELVRAVFVKHHPWTVFAHWSYGAPITLREMPDYIILAHELIHAYHNLHGKQKTGEPANLDGYTDLEEENTIIGVPGLVDYTENAIRREFGLRERQFHFGALARQDPYRDQGCLMLV